MYMYIELVLEHDITEERCGIKRKTLIPKNKFWTRDTNMNVTQTNIKGTVIFSYFMIPELPEMQLYCLYQLSTGTVLTFQSILQSLVNFCKLSLKLLLFKIRFWKSDCLHFLQITPPCMFGQSFLLPWQPVCFGSVTGHVTGVWRYLFAKDIHRLHAKIFYRLQSHNWCFG